MSLLEFEISIPRIIFARQNSEKFSKKRYLYEIQARKAQLQSFGAQEADLDLVDTTVKKFQDFRILHSNLVSAFSTIKIPKFPELPRPRVNPSVPEGKVPEYVEDRRVALQHYIQQLQKIEEVADSYEFQQFLPKACQMRAKMRHRGVNIIAYKYTGRFSSKKILINVNSKLKLIRVSFPSKETPKLTARTTFTRKNILFSEIEGWEDSTEWGKRKIALHLKNGDSMEFYFKSLSNADIFSDLLKSTQHDDTLNSFESSRPISPHPQVTSLGEVSPVLLSEEIITEPVSIYIASWNLARANHSPFIQRFLPEKGGDFDVIVFGFQECNSFNGKYQSADVRIAENILEYLGENYYMVGRKGIWEISVNVFAKKELKPNISIVESKSVATGFLGVMGNKGAAMVGFRIFNTSIAFLASHLASDQEKVHERNAMFAEIVAGLKMRDPLVHFSFYYDAIFWCGDLNYRINLSPKTVAEFAKNKLWDSLLKREQLRSEMINNRVFCGFKEGPVDFPPTYKLYSENRKTKKKSGEFWEPTPSSSKGVFSSTLYSKFPRYMLNAIFPLNEADTAENSEYSQEEILKDESYHQRPLASPESSGMLGSLDNQSALSYAVKKNDSNRKFRHRSSSAGESSQFTGRKFSSFSGVALDDLSLNDSSPSMKLNHPAREDFDDDDDNEMILLSTEDFISSGKSILKNSETVTSKREEDSYEVDSVSSTNSFLSSKRHGLSERSSKVDSLLRSHTSKGTHRVYDLNRVPSWTDRILWKVNQTFGDSDLVVQFSYGHGPTSAESDHIPIVAAFELNARVSSLNPCSSEDPIELYIKSVNAQIFRDCVRLHRVFEGVEGIYLYIHGSSLSNPVSSRSRPVPYIGPDSVAITQLEDDESKSSISLGDPKIVDLDWKDSDISCARLVSGSREYLRHLRIYVSVCISDSKNVLLQSMISLEPIAFKKSWLIRVPLMYNGIQCGILNARAFIDTKSI